MLCQAVLADLAQVFQDRLVEDVHLVIHLRHCFQLLPVPLQEGLVQTGQHLRDDFSHVPDFEADALQCH